MKPLSLSGNFLFNVYSYSIVMEYADSGDLFQQICDHQKNNTLFKEDDIWKMFI
jgi:hypothetical protein